MKISVLSYIEVQRDQILHDLVHFDSLDKSKIELDSLFEDTKAQYLKIFKESDLDITKTEATFIITVKGWYPRLTAQAMVYEIEEVL